MTTDQAQSMIGSCTITAGPQPACIEYSDASPDALELDAKPQCHQGAWRNESCARDNAIGGCTTDVEGPYGRFTLTDWYYVGGPLVTAADVMAKCSALSMAFVAP